MDYKTLIEIYQSDAGLQKEFPDPNGQGISGDWDLQEWANRYLAIDYPNVELVQPGDPKLSSSVPKRGDDDKNTLTRFESDPTRDDISTNEHTVFLYNKTNRTYTPIKNEESLMALLRVDSVEEAFSHVNVLPVSVLNSPEWKGSFGSFSGAIKEDGVPPTEHDPVPGSEIDDIKDLYGATQRMSPEDEAFTENVLGVILTPAKRKGDISENVWNENMGNPVQLAKYISALAYGKYNIPQHIYADLKAKTLLEQGHQEYANFKTFDETMGYDQWITTEEGKKLASDKNLVPPENILDIDIDMFSNPIFDIPNAAFSTLIKPIDIESPEFKAEAEEIQASYYDIMMQKAEAETEQAKAIADHNWTIFKNNLEKKHGLQLSDNAKTAWGQLQELFSGSREAGLSGTGLEREVQDRYMKDVRDRDQLLRESKMDEEEMELRNKLLNSGSSEDIAAFVAEHGEDKAKEWGLIPSDEMKQWFSKENLKSLYPDMTDDEIDRISGMVIDPETGNYKSQLYQNLYSNKYQLGEEKKTYQWEKLFKQKEQEEKEAYAQYTHANPFRDLKDALGDEFKEKDEVDTGEGKRYYYKPGNNIDVYDRETEKHVTAKEAAKIPDFWSQVKKPGSEPFTPDPTSDIPSSQQAMRDAVQKNLPKGKRYYYKPGNNIDVYDRETGKHVTAEEAAKIPDFWSQVKKHGTSASSYTPPKVKTPVYKPPKVKTPVYKPPKVKQPKKDKSHQTMWKNGKSTIVLGYEVPDYLKRGYTQ